MDKKHSEIMNKIIKEYRTRLSNSNNIEPEYYYNHFGLKGFIDLVITDQHEPYTKRIIEIKTEPNDIGEIIRQLNVPERVLKQEKTITKYRLVKVLALPLSEKNRDFIKQHQQILIESKIMVWFIIKEPNPKRGIIDALAPNPTVYHDEWFFERTNKERYYEYDNHL